MKYEKVGLPFKFYFFFSILYSVPDLHINWSQGAVIWGWRFFYHALVHQNLFVWFKDCFILYSGAGCMLGFLVKKLNINNKSLLLMVPSETKLSWDLLQQFTLEKKKSVFRSFCPTCFLKQDHCQHQFRPAMTLSGFLKSL